MSTRLTEAEWIWKDGELVRWRDATVHLLSLAVQFGSSVFEGIRCYRTPSGPAVFRLPEHIRRLFDSARIYRMAPAHDEATVARACVDTVRRNGLGECWRGRCEHHHDREQDQSPLLDHRGATASLADSARSNRNGVVPGTMANHLHAAVSP